VERLPEYIRRLTWGSKLYYFNELDICVHKKQNHFCIIKCSTGETTKVSLQHVYQFMACNKTNKLFFVRITHGKLDYTKPYGGVKSYLHFYVYDLSNGLYKKSKAFSRPTPLGEWMSSFISEDEDIATVINCNGDVFTVGIDTLEVKMVMCLGELVEDVNQFFRKPWYKTGLNVYETDVSRQRQWYEEKPDSSQNSDYLFAKIDLANKTLECRAGQGGPYDTSVFLEAIGIWVHHKPNNYNRLKASSFFFDIRKNDEIIWQFEIPCKPDDGRLFGEFKNNIASFSENIFVICFTKMIYLCNLQDLSLENISFGTGMADVFYDKGKGHIIPVYFAGTTEDMITLDDFSC